MGFFLNKFLSNTQYLLKYHQLIFLVYKLFFSNTSFLETDCITITMFSVLMQYYSFRIWPTFMLYTGKIIMLKQRREP